MRNFKYAVLMMCGIAIGFFALIGVVEFVKNPRGGQVVAEKHNAHEDAALAMIRIGMLDWQMACAWSVGHDGRSRDEMFRACSVELNVGEPKHPERRRR